MLLTSGSLDEDAASVRLFVSRGMEVLVAQSYSKNLGLDTERVGAINVISSTPEYAKRVQSQLKRLAKSMYFSPPVHGARIVATIVGNQALFDEWKEEMETMAERLKAARDRLHGRISSKDKDVKDWSFILKQTGMFSFTGLNKNQIDYMKDKWDINMLNDGRIPLLRFPLDKLEDLVDAILDSYHNAAEMQ
ncbi:aspartate transaminase [Trifolium repens]|nr:aspartate transaminase [Trifolium repens]